MDLDANFPTLVGEHHPISGVHCLTYKKADNPTLAIYGSLRAGTAFEPPDKPGIAELTTRLLIRGTVKLKSHKLANQLESVGATLSFRNSQDSIVFQARTTSVWTQRVLGIMSDCLTRPAFDHRDVEREKEELLTDIRMRDDETTRRGMKELHDLIYPDGHPYRRDRFGTPASVKKIERTDVTRYFEESMSKAPVVVAFAGKLDGPQVLNWAEKTFGQRHENVNPVDQSTPMHRAKPEHKEIVMGHKTQTDILMGAPAIARTHSDYEPFNLLNVVLGELGFMGRLGQRVRDKEGLAYSCTSFLNAASLGGNWTALAGVNPRNIVKAMALMREEIDLVCRQPVESQELESAKQNQIGSALMELESTEGIARTSHNLAYFHLGLDYFARRRELYNKITEQHLQEMAQRYIESPKLSTVVVGPKAKVSSES